MAANLAGGRTKTTTAPVAEERQEKADDAAMARDVYTGTDGSGGDEGEFCSGTLILPKHGPERERNSHEISIQPENESHDDSAYSNSVHERFAYGGWNV